MARSSSNQRGHFSLIALVAVTGLALIILAQFQATLVPRRALGFREAEGHRRQWLDQLTAEVLASPPEESRGTLTIADEDCSYRQWRDADGDLDARLLTLSATDHEDWPQLRLLRLTSSTFDFYLLDCD